ncbi:hypothetical protein PR048_009899 [Dryococelus australis]|uniref:Uncharacterized protein n=1 Tax=Dryococelus australis TaxID=614101 RepID=A0ABQ9I1Z3_9NEOP|nr:hypothetical protein PR048_009899 [Dryococelus australis]
MHVVLIVVDMVLIVMHVVLIVVHVLLIVAHVMLIIVCVVLHYNNGRTQFIQGDILKQHIKICKDSSFESQQVSPSIPTAASVGTVSSGDYDETVIVNFVIRDLQDMVEWVDGEEDELWRIIGGVLESGGGLVSCVDVDDDLAMVTISMSSLVRSSALVPEGSSSANALLKCFQSIPRCECSAGTSTRGKLPLMEMLPGRDLLRFKRPVIRCRLTGIIVGFASSRSAGALRATRVRITCLVIASTVKTEILHALGVGAMRRLACVLVSPVSLPRFLTLNALLHRALEDGVIFICLIHSKYTQQCSPAVVYRYDHKGVGCHLGEYCSTIIPPVVAIGEVLLPVLQTAQNATPSCPTHVQWGTDRVIVLAREQQQNGLGDVLDVAFTVQCSLNKHQRRTVIVGYCFPDQDVRSWSCMSLPFKLWLLPLSWSTPHSQTTVTGAKAESALITNHSSATFIPPVASFATPSEAGCTVMSLASGTLDRSPESSKRLVMVLADILSATGALICAADAVRSVMESICSCHLEPASSCHTQILPATPTVRHLNGDICRNTFSSLGSTTQLCVSGHFSHTVGDPGSIAGRTTPDFRMWESCRTMPLVGGFPRESPVSPTPSLRRCSILTSITHVGSEDLDFQSRLNPPLRHNFQVRVVGDPHCSRVGLPTCSRRVAGSRPGASDVADAQLDCRTGNSSTKSVSLELRQRQMKIAASYGTLAPSRKKYGTYVKVAVNSSRTLGPRRKSNVVLPVGVFSNYVCRRWLLILARDLEPTNSAVRNEINLDLQFNSEFEWCNSFLCRSQMRSRIEFRTTMVQPGISGDNQNQKSGQHRAKSQEQRGADVHNNHSSSNSGYPEVLPQVAKVSLLTCANLIVHERPTYG